MAGRRRRRVNLCGDKSRGGGQALLELHLAWLSGGLKVTLMQFAVLCLPIQSIKSDTRSTKHPCFDFPSSQLQVPTALPLATP